MEKINSYVFLQKNESKLKKDKNETYILETNKVCSVLKEVFNAEDNDLTLEKLETPTDETEEKFEKMLLGETTGNFQLEIFPMLNYVKIILL